MPDAAKASPYTLEPDDKAAQVMAYTAGALFWGEVVVKDVIRVSTWLRTKNAPNRICLYNGRAVYSSPGQSVRPMHFSEINIAVNQIMMFHLVPPAKDPLDYDPTEPNRRMLPVSALVGNFRVDGHLRIPTISNITRYLDSIHEEFTSLYDAHISNPAIPAFGTIAVSYLILRQETTVFTLA
jgi:hypothetical protein